MGILGMDSVKLGGKNGSHGAIGNVDTGNLVACFDVRHVDPIQTVVVNLGNVQIIVTLGHDGNMVGNHGVIGVDVVEMSSKVTRWPHKEGALAANTGVGAEARPRALDL